MTANIQKKVLYYLDLFLIAALVGMLIFMIAYTGRNKKSILQCEPLQEIILDGSCQIDGQPSIPIEQISAVENENADTCILKVHVKKEIEKNEYVLFRIRNLNVHIALNGKTVYEFIGDSQNYLTKSPGDVWDCLKSEGIKPEDELVISLQTVYKDQLQNGITQFIENLQTGNVFSLFQSMFRENGHIIILSVLIFLSGIIIFTVSMITKKTSGDMVTLGMAFSFLTVLGGAWILFDGNYKYMSLLMPNANLLHLLDYSCSIWMPAIICFVVYSVCKSNWSKIMHVLLFATLCMEVVCYILQIEKKRDLLEQQKAVYCIIFITTTICLTALLHEILAHKNKAAISVGIGLLPLYGGVLMECLNLLFHFIPERICIRHGFVLSCILTDIFILIQLRYNVAKINYIREIEQEMMQNKIAVMLSQIQPHFLYNSLTAIGQLCAVNPQQAEESVYEFAHYLRGNLDSLGNGTDLIPFEKELEHINHYLALEKMRFGDRLNIKYELGDTEFFLPALTVQPIVENAVRYGATKKACPGTVQIKTYRRKTEIYIEVIDDGPGFILEKKDTSRSHIGMENVRNRLYMQCHGTLHVRSIMGKGTKVTIKIPQLMPMKGM